VDARERNLSELSHLFIIICTTTMDVLIIQVNCDDWSTEKLRGLNTTSASRQLTNNTAQLSDVSLALALDSTYLREFVCFEHGSRLARQQNEKEMVCLMNFSLSCSLARLSLSHSRAAFIKSLLLLLFIILFFFISRFHVIAFWAN
jgi:hypothetical protein